MPEKKTNCLNQAAFSQMGAASENNVNQRGYQKRLDTIHAILQSFGMKPTSIEPIAYSEHGPCQYNNFIYKVVLESPALESTFSVRQPCTSLIPQDGISTLVVRLNNPYAEGPLNNTNRLENEVAASYLIHQSLERSGLGSLVPSIYAWAPTKYPQVRDESGFGWTISEFKTGDDLDSQFEEMDEDHALDAVQQLAKIFTLMQSTEVSHFASNFGGLSIDKRGYIFSAQSTLVHGGPWASYEEQWVGKLQQKLSEADASTTLQGWKDSPVRKRLEHFITSGQVQTLLKVVDCDQRVLVHGDFTMNNVLYDKSTKRITALLDFDWASITHPCEEFLSGLWDVGGGIHERVGDLRSSILSGNFGMEPEGVPQENIRKWKVAKAWDEALLQNGAIRPSDIAGVEGIRTLKELEDLICPFVLGCEFFANRLSEEERLKRKGDTEDAILKLLDRA